MKKKKEEKTKQIKQTKSSKEIKLINIRFFAILMVVLGHSIIIYSESWNVFETIHSVAILNYLKKFIGIFQMPLFFSLSGYLFYYTCCKQRKFWTFLKDKFLRLIVPFVCVTALYMIPLKMLLNVPAFTSNNYFALLYRNIFELKSSGHLWFCIVLFIIFIIYFILDKIFKLSIKDKKHFVIDALILVGALGFRYFAPDIKEIINLTAIYRVATYLFWFYLGFIICKYFELGKKEDSSKLWFVPYLCILTGGSIVYTMLRGGFIFNMLSAFLFIVTIYLIVPAKTNKYVEYIERNSMGMFLLHSPLIYISFTYFPNINPILMVFINFVIYGLLTTVISELLRKTKLKFIIGEK